MSTPGLIALAISLLVSAGIAALQRASGATVVASASGAEGFALGNAVPDDPPAADPFIDPQACRVLAANAMKALDARVAEESKK